MASSEVQYAPIATSATDTTIVPAVAGRKIRVVSLVLVASGGANNARLESGTGGTALSGVMNLAANGQLVLQRNISGWTETAVGALLNLELSAVTAVGGMIAYVLVE
jgi:hypothetical protein